MGVVFSRLLLAIWFASSTTTSVEAFSLKKAIRDVGNVVRSVPSVARNIPSPLNTQIDIITGKTKPQNIIQNEGQRLQNLANEVRKIDNIAQDNITGAAHAVGGDFGRVVVEFSTGLNRYQKEFLLTATNATGAILQGQDPLLAVASPLAAALRDAHNKYNATARPLPAEFRQLFAPFIPAHILNRARYSVDNLKISLPSLINNGQRLFGKDHAVVVDDIIVFSKAPNANNASDIHWVAHEIHHVYQYAMWGVDLFALNYIRNSSRVEGEADQAADMIYSLVMQAGGGSSATSSMHPNDMAFARAQTINTPLGTTQVVMPGQASGLPHAVSITDRCIVMGEHVIITNTHAVISPMRFQQVVAQRVAPSVPGCVFEMVNPTARFCVSPQNGAVFIPTTPFPVGRCVQCQFGNC